MLTDDQVEAYRRDGFLQVRHVVTGDELDRLRAAADGVMDEAVAHGRALDAEYAIELDDDHGFRDWAESNHKGFLYGRSPDGARVWRRAELMFTRDPSFRTVAVHPSIVAIARRIMGDDAIVANESMVVKMPGHGAAVPWHRDPSSEAYLEREGDASGDFTIDIYLDRSTVGNGCVWAIPGSHRGQPVPDDDLDFTVDGAVPLKAEPGDVLLHSTGVLHGSPTSSGTLRRTFYLHYRPPSILATDWARPQEWIDERIALFAQLRAERDAALAH